MKKSYKLALLLSLVVPFSVNAASEKVTTSEELTKCISENQECTIDSAITVEKITIDGKNVTIDLNGNTLTSTIIVKGKANLTITDSKGNGEVVSGSKGDRTVTVNEGSQFTLENGTIRSLKSDGVAAYSGNFLMNGGKVIAQEMGIVYFNGANVTINKGTIETKDNCAMGDNGTAGAGGNTVHVNGGNLISNISSPGYISCGIYNANDTTLTVKSGTKITANKGGAGIVIRGGKVTVDNQVIKDMVTGNSEGRVGDSRVIVSGKVVKDYSSNYPAKNTIDVQINYNTVSSSEGSTNLSNKQENALNEEIKKIINNNTIEKLNNVDLANISIKTVVKNVTEKEKESAIEKVKDVLKDFKNGKVLDLGVVVNNKDSVIANLTETSNKIPFGIDVSNIATNDKLNYEFQIIRCHIDADGKEQIEVLDSAYDPTNHVVTFETDKFSTYLINYKTSPKTEDSKTEVTNPSTFDGIAIFGIIGLLSLVGLGKTLKTLKNRG